MQMQRLLKEQKEAHEKQMEEMRQNMVQQHQKHNVCQALCLLTGLHIWLAVPTDKHQGLCTHMPTAQMYLGPCA